MNPPTKQAIMTRPAACWDHFACSKYSLDSGSILYNAEKSFWVVSIGEGANRMEYYHNTKTQTERACQEDIAILYAKVLLAREQTNDHVNTYYGGANNAS